ncbi:MAG: glyoxylase-like metal-dependent hydrolase (beta-lactamase superfamily II) [Gammaproteobacteria bacterium]|jgi:glyoxylase-like metal-dependent hydrolase (beta-lactamase superfamily II)
MFIYSEYTSRYTPIDTMLSTLTVLLLVLVSFTTQAETHKFTTPESILDMKAVEVTNNVYVIHGVNENPGPENQGLIANLGIVISNKGVIVIDSGGSQAHGNLLLTEIASITSMPVIAVFNTHIHGDHWLGNNAIHTQFPEAVFYAHPMTVESAQSATGTNWVTLLNQLTDGALTGTKPYTATQSISDNDSIQFGDVTIKIQSKDTAAHTLTDIIVSVELASNISAIFVGDVGLHQRIGRMDDGSFKGSIEALDKAISLQSTIYVPGHGPSTRGPSSAQLYRDYLSTLYEETERWYDEGLSDFEIKKKIRPAFDRWQHWAGFDSAFGRHVSLVFLEIEEASF